MANRRVTTVILIVLNLAAAVASSPQRTPAIEVLGLRVGIGKAEARSHLKEISEFVRNEGRNQEIWKLKDASRFSEVAVGYSEDKIRYITAFVDKKLAKEHIAFSSVGDLNTAKAEIVGQHHRYIWDVPASSGNAACSVNVYGDNPEFITMFTIVARSGPGDPGEADEDID